MPSETEKLAWTTWEELLLACAVKRHGTQDWGSVAMELQTRSAPSLLFSSQVCRNKYHDLKRRFTENNVTDDTIPWLEDLRNLRVSELRQEVHRYDLSIQSLQLKVKSLEEERERSVKENENDDVGEPDLEKTSDEERSENDKNDDGARPPEITVGDVSDRAENLTEPVGTRGFKLDPVQSDSKPASENSSYIDSSNTVAAKVSRKKKGGELAELGDSVKESSDVQSSANLTRKRRREKEVSGVKRAEEGVKKSEPLDVGLLDIIRAHKHGSMFERRLGHQSHRHEYKNMVRSHMDLETIRTRLENGSYSSCTTKFYRDLLLLFTNAIVFFPKASIESITAHELRDLVLEQVKKQNLSTQRSDSSSPDPAPSNPTPPETKPESLLTLAKHKPSSGPPVLVCRKRSSISAKTSQTENGKSNLNPANKSLNLKDEESRKTEERPVVTGTRSTRRNNGNQTSRPDSKTNSLADKAENAMQNDEKKKKKKKSEVAAVAVKKQVAVDFLRRISKRISPLKSGGGDHQGNSGGGGRAENRKRGGDGKKEAALAPLVKPGRRKEERSSPMKQGGGTGRPSRKGPAEGAGTNEVQRLGRGVVALSTVVSRQRLLPVRPKCRRRGG